MAEPTPASDSTETRRFQFSLRTALGVITGVSLLLSLGVWKPVVGSMVSIPIVCGYWAVCAVRAGRRRLAYYLAAFAMGGAISLLLLVLVPSAGLFEWRGLDDPWERYFPLVPILWMCVATVSCAAVLRRWIRRPGIRTAVVTGLFAPYVTVLFWYWYLVLRWPIDLKPLGLAYLGSAAVWLPLLTLFLGTLSLPFGAPIGVGLCILLRRIDPIEPTLNEGQKEILRAIDALAARGEDPIWPHHIVERTEADPGEVAAQLEHLCRLGVLKKSASNGYRHVRSVRRTAH